MNNVAVLQMSLTNNFVWDYKGFYNRLEIFDYTQKDWNQTLITKINQISAKVFKISNKCGIKTLHVPNKYKSLFETLMYYNNGNNNNNFDATLSGRYNIKYVNYCENIIFDNIGILKILNFE
jgi:hypothetical protein